MRFAPPLINLWNSIGNAKAKTFALSDQALTSGINFLVSIALIKLVGFEEFGRFSIAFLILMIVRNFQIGMLLSPMSAIVPGLNGNGLVSYRSFIKISALVLSISVSCFLAGLLTLVGLKFDINWLIESALLIGAVNMLMMIYDFVRRFCFISERPSKALVSGLARHAVVLAALVIPLASDPERIDFSYALIALALGCISGIAVAYAGFGHSQWNPRDNTIFWRRHRRFVTWGGASVMADSIQGGAPLLIGAAVLGEEALGAVRIIQQLANMLTLPAIGLQQVGVAEASKELAEKGGDAGRQALIKIAGLNVVFFLSMAIVLAVSISFLLTAVSLTSGPLEISIFSIYIFCAFISSVKIAAMMYLELVQQPIYLAVASLASLGVCLAAAVTLINLTGEIGIPIASLLANATAFILILLCSRKVAGQTEQG